MKDLSFLSLLNGAIITDLLFMSFLLLGWMPSATLAAWYRDFGIGAMIVDILILVLIVLLAYYLYPYVFGQSYSILKFSTLAVGLQLIHDGLFSLFFYSFPRNANRLVSIMQRYMSQHGLRILIADALMVLSTIGFQYLFSGAFQQTGQTILTILLVYLSPYFVFSVK
jgi:hypothetical protein